MAVLKDLFEKRSKLVADARTLNDSVTGKMTPEQESRWNAMNTEIDTLGASIDRQKKLDVVEDSDRAAAEAEEVRAKTRQDRKTPGLEDTDAESRGEKTLDERRALAVSGWFAEHGDGTPSDEEVEAAKSLNFNLRSKQMSLGIPGTRSFARVQAAHRSYGHGREERVASAAKARESRDMAAGSGPVGGYLTAPEQMVNSLETAMLLHGGIYEQADIIRTAQGGEITWPSANDTSNTGEWLAEAQTSGTTSTDPSFGKVRWGAHKVSSKPILVSYELLRDSMFDLPSILGGMLGERIGRAKSTAFGTGSGAGKPLGITLSSVLGVTAAGTGSITLDEMIDLISSVGRAYRGPGCGFLMKDATVAHFRKKKDGNGNYIWQQGTLAGQPDTLFSYPVYTSDDMPAMTTGLKSVVFGQLKSYKVREVGAIRVYRLGELYRVTDQDGFVAFHECDGGLLDAGTNPVKHLIQA